MPVMLTRYYTEALLRETARRMIVVIDSREKENRHITEYLDEKKLPYIIRKLDTGDYSAMIGDCTLERQFVIERKHSLQELYRNLTSDRQRFEAELMRAKNDGIRTVLLTENTTMEELYTGDPFRNIPPGKAAQLFLELTAEYDIFPFFINDCYSGRLIAHLLRNEMKLALLNSPAMPEIGGAYEQ